MRIFIDITLERCIETQWSGAACFPVSLYNKLAGFVIDIVPIMTNIRFRGNDHSGSQRVPRSERLQACLSEFCPRRGVPEDRFRDWHQCRAVTVGGEIHGVERMSLLD